MSTTDLNTPHPTPPCVLCAMRRAIASLAEKLGDLRVDTETLASVSDLSPAETREFLICFCADLEAIETALWSI